MVKFTLTLKTLIMDNNIINKRVKYIANGNYFNSFDEVLNYAKSLKLRITSTVTIRKNTFLISLNK